MEKEQGENTEGCNFSVPFPWLRDLRDPSKSAQDTWEEHEKEEEQQVQAQRELPCATRPAYRATNRETKVKVYTVNEESRYLIICNIPAVGAITELIKKLSIYGKIEEYMPLDSHDQSTDYTDVLWVKYETINNARHAKRLATRKPFYSHILRISYAPEYETIEDTKAKIDERKRLLCRRAEYQKQKHSGKAPQQSSVPSDFIGPQLRPPSHRNGPSTHHLSRVSTNNSGCSSSSQGSSGNTAHQKKAVKKRRRI